MQNSDLWRSGINFHVIRVKIATLIVDLVITGPRSKSLSMSWGVGREPKHECEAARGRGCEDMLPWRKSEFLITRS